MLLHHPKPLSFSSADLFEQYIFSAIHHAGLSARIHTANVIDHEGRLRFISFISPKMSHVLWLQRRYGQWELFAQISREKSIRKKSVDIDVVMMELKWEIES